MLIAINQLYTSHTFKLTSFKNKVFNHFSFNISWQFIHDEQVHTVQDMQEQQTEK